MELVDCTSAQLGAYLRGAAVVLGGTCDRQNHLATVCREVAVRCVYGTAGIHVRRYLWYANQERRQRRGLRIAQGVQ